MRAVGIMLQRIVASTTPKSAPGLFSQFLKTPSGAPTIAHGAKNSCPDTRQHQSSQAPQISQATLSSMPFRNVETRQVAITTKLVPKHIFTMSGKKCRTQLAFSLPLHFLQGEDATVLTKMEPIVGNHRLAQDVRGKAVQGDIILFAPKLRTTQVMVDPL